MRLFIAIELPSDVRTAIAKIAHDCRTRIAAAAPRAKLRWVPADNLHITLWFLGEVDEAGAEALSSALRGPFRAGRFEARLDGLGVYPANGDPRVVWMGIDRGHDTLTSIHEELKERLPVLGFEAEPRPFSAHVSLARVKHVHRSDGAVVRSIVRASSTGSLHFAVSEVTLFRSWTLPEGSRYEGLLRVPLS
jgi:2'-5' RNA ligase